MKRTLLALCVLLMVVSCDRQKVVTYHDQSNQVASVAYLKNGERDGVYQEYYASGILKKECMYTNGQLHGPMDEFDEQGTLVIASGWVNGKREGYTNQYYKNGTVYVSDFYRQGVPWKEKIVYHVNGRVAWQDLLDSLGNAIYYLRWDEQGKKTISYAAPIVKILQDTLPSLSDSAIINVSFGYKLKGKLGLRLDGLDEMKAPSIEYQYDSVNVRYRLAMRFSEPGLHKMMLDVRHTPEPGDTLSADGGTQEIHIFVKSPRAL